MVKEQIEAIDQINGIERLEENCSNKMFDKK